MSPETLRILIGFVHRLFLLGVIFAVLWAKGYLWWVFGLALGLYLASAVMVPVAHELARGGRDAEWPDADSDEDDESPPVPPTKPFRARPE